METEQDNAKKTLKGSCKGKKGFQPGNKLGCGQKRGPSKATIKSEAIRDSIWEAYWDNGGKKIIKDLLAEEGGRGEYMRLLVKTFPKQFELEVNAQITIADVFKTSAERMESQCGPSD